jgi:hypothetical protein
LHEAHASKFVLNYNSYTNKFDGCANHSMNSKGNKK